MCSDLDILWCHHINKYFRYDAAVFYVTVMIVIVMEYLYVCKKKPGPNPNPNLSRNYRLDCLPAFYRYFLRKNH